MLRAWLRAGLCVCAVSFVGCGGDSRESIISNTTTQITQAATSLGNIKAKVEEFVKKKEAKDEEGAKKELDEAVGEAKTLKEVAKNMQNLSAQANARTPPTPEEKKALLEKHQSRINDTHGELKTAHREMKRAIDDAKKKYEEAMAPLIQALNDAEGEFAAIARRK
jgi:TolA-binding protein